jgi:hypothetical protein
MANYLSSISVAMNKVVKLLLQLVKVCSDAKASISTILQARAHAGLSIVILLLPITSLIIIHRRNQTLIN